MAALVAVMIMVSIGAFDWHSIRPSTLRRMPLSETAVMLVTVLVTVISHNLAFGVGAGVVVASVLFARRVAHLTTVTRVPGTDRDGEITYAVTGQLFFASSNDLVYQFDYAGDPERVVIDLSGATIWDASTVATLDAITNKYARRGKQVTIVGMDPTSASRHERLAGQLGGE